MTAMPPSTVRFRVLALATMVAFLMYLDRICLAEIVGSASFRASVELSQSEVASWVATLGFWLPQSWREGLAGAAPMALIKGAFFWAYALAMVPAGWLSDRFGARGLITLYIALWSVFTMATSLSWGFTSLMVARLGCGLAEAGYFPASSGFLTRWAHIEARGFASGMIAWGGRVGGALAPLLTAWLIAWAGDWRIAGWTYGVAGLFVAAAYWIMFRDHPRGHPGVNAAEMALLAEGRGDFQPSREPPRRFPWRAACGSGNLWLANGVQFFTNIGWAFLVLYLGDYLRKVLHVGDKESGILTTVALSIGVLSIPLGGWVVDALSRRYGRTLGRKLPMSVTKFIAAGFYLVAVQTQSVWAAVLCFGLVTFFADFGLPAIWTTMQDISGRHQAQLFGWGNMWGNFGAGLQPLIFAWVLGSLDSNGDMREGVWCCALALGIAGLLGCFVDAEKPVETVTKEA